MASIIRRLRRRMMRPRSSGRRLRYRVDNRAAIPFTYAEPDGTVVVNAHSQQFEAYAASERFVLILAGTRGGKSAIGPWWLLKQMREHGPGEYLACAPSYPLFKKGAYKAIRRVFVTLLKLGKIVGGARGEFQFSPEGFRLVWPDHEYDEEAKIVFAHAANPDSLEAAEYKAAWLDEPGQKGFPLESWEAIQRRLSIDQGPALMTTTPYMIQHWIISEVHDRARRRDTDAERPEDKHCRVVSFESRSNPAFPMEEWDRAQAVLPEWKFNLFYRGIISKPPGAIFDCFDVDTHVVPTFNREKNEPIRIPEHWPRTIACDFGAPNFAAAYIAEEVEESTGPHLPNVKPKLKKTGRKIVYAEYRPDSAATAKEHIAAMRKVESDLRQQWGQLPLPSNWRPNNCVGGALSEVQWRKEFAAHGWQLQPPDNPEVEVHIDRTYAAFKTDRLFIADRCARLISEVLNYSRPVDEQGNVLEGIEDKETFHGVDSLRYGIAFLDRKGTDFYIGVF